jgi:hypothetical protein
VKESVCVSAHECVHECLSACMTLCDYVTYYKINDYYEFIRLYKGLRQEQKMKQQ